MAKVLCPTSLNVKDPRDFSVFSLLTRLFGAVDLVGGDPANEADLLVGVRFLAGTV